MPPPAPVPYDVLCSRVRSLVEEMPRPPVVAICGHGGAGKSTLATRLAADLGGVPEHVIRTDRLYARGAGPDAGLFDLHDWSTLLELLHRLRETPTPARLVYQARTYAGVERICDTPMPPVVIVEGIRLLRPETIPLLDLTVWISLSPDEAAVRAVARNRDQGDSPAELDLWRTKWIPEAHAYATLICPDQLADVVVTSDPS